MTSPRVHQNQLWQEAAEESLNTFIAWLDRAEEEGSLYAAENFAAFLDVSLNRLQIPATELIKDEEISKAAMSRWVSGQAVPSMPTRKHMVATVRTIAKSYLDQFRPM
jgi:hypothetical protein